MRLVKRLVIIRNTSNIEALQEVFMRNPFNIWPEMGIRKRVYFLLLIVFVPLFLLEVFIYSTWFQNRKQTEMETNLELARAVGKNFETFLDSLIRNELAVGLVLRASRSLTDRDRDRLLGMIEKDNPAVHSIFWLDPSGTVIASSLQGFVGFNLSERSFYKRINEGQAWAVSELIIGKITDKPIFTVARAIRNDDGKLIGVVAAAVDPEGLDHILGIARTKGAGVSLVDNKGMHVYRYPSTKYTWEQRNWLTLYPMIEDSLKGKEVVATVVSKPDGKNLLAAFTPVSSIGWVVMCSRAEDEVMADINNTMLPIGVLMLLVTAAAFGAAVGLSRPITAAILRIRKRAIAVGNGRRESMDIISGPRELKELGDAFNQMASQVQLREEALRQARDELEYRVEERTQELQKAYDRLVDETNKREKLEGQLRQSEKMQAIGTLSGGIAHDFNNMLAVILGNAELALEDIDDTTARGASTKNSIEQIIKASKRSRDLVRQILLFSRKTDIQRKVVNLSVVLQETISLLRGSIPNSIDVKVDTSLDRDTIIGDPSQIQQVLMNLASNAVHAMQEDGGALTISLSTAHLKAGELTPELQPGRYVKLTVSDTGKGMSRELCERIFDPFFTTKKQGEGTGMGLSVVFGIVKSHEGAITVTSKEGEGSSFNVFLPIFEKQPAEEERYKEDSLPGGNERILLVDDEVSILEMAAKHLENLGYQVTTAMGGAEALEMFSQEPERFDLLITDYVMPKMTGANLAERILERKRDLPVILFTGYGDAISLELLKQAGINEVLLKPVVKKELAETVRAILDGRKET